MIAAFYENIVFFDSWIWIVEIRRFFSIGFFPMSWSIVIGYFLDDIVVIFLRFDLHCGLLSLHWSRSNTWIYSNLYIRWWASLGFVSIQGNREWNDLGSRWKGLLFLFTVSLLINEQSVLIKLDGYWAQCLTPFLKCFTAVGRSRSDWCGYWC